MTMPALGELEAETLAGQVHFSDLQDTGSFLMMLVASLEDERERWTAARRRHDHQAATESALEMQVLVQLAGACADHLRAVAPRAVLH
jgi:hypothetical protein